MTTTATPAGVRLGDSVPLALFMATIVLAFASQIQPVIVAGAVLCGVYAWLARSSAPATRIDFVLFVGAALLFLPAFIKPYHGLSPIFYFLSTVAAFFAALAAARKPPAVLLSAFSWIYRAAIVAIGWVLYTYWGHPEPFGMVIEGTSTNGIPAYLIVIQIAVSLSFYLVHHRLPVWSPLLTAAVAFFGNGRGSLVVAGLIIVGTLLLNLLPSHGGDRRRLRYHLVFVVASVGALFAYGEELLEFVSAYTKLSVGLVDTNRLEIWEQYSGKIDAFTFLFGADYAGTNIESEYKNNPHIAYIRTHSFFGLPLTALALLSPLFVLFARKARAAKLVFFCFIGLAALRAATEPIFFPTLLDFFYFSYFLMFFNHAQPATARPRRRRGAATVAQTPPRLESA